MLQYVMPGEHEKAVWQKLGFATRSPEVRPCPSIWKPCDCGHQALRTVASPSLKGKILGL